MSFIRATLCRADDEILMPVSLICPEGTSVRAGEAQSHSLSFTKEWVHIQNWMRMRDRVELAFARRGHRHGTEAGGIPAGSSPVGVAQKWVRTPGCQQALRQTLLWCQMGALLPKPAWGFSRAAGSHIPCPVCGLQAGSVGCWASLSRAFSGDVGRYGNFIWNTFDGHGPHPVPTRHCPIPEAFSVQDEMLAL